MSEGHITAGVKSAHVTLDVLEQIAASEDGLGVSAIAARLGFTKGAVFRHLQTLLERGYLTQEAPSTKYRLGVRSALLGRLAAKNGDLIAVSRAAMRSLRDKTGETVTLAAITAREVVVLECVMGTGSLEIGIKPGHQLPVHATSHGKVALAFSQQLNLSALPQTLKRLTEHSPCDRRQLESEVALTRERGWASSPQQMLLGVNALSAPVFNAAGVCIAAVALVGSIQFIPAEPRTAQVTALLRTARDISQGLGFNALMSRRRPSLPYPR